MWSTLLVLSLLAPSQAAGMDARVALPPPSFAVDGPPSQGRLEGFCALEVEPEGFADALGAPKIARIPSLSAYDEDPATLLLGFMPVVHLGVDRERLGELGLSLEDVAAVLPEGRGHELSHDGLDLSVRFTGHDEVAEPAALLDALASLSVPTADGRTVPLSDLTDPWIGARDQQPPASGVAPGPLGRPSPTPVIETLPPPPHPARGDLVVHNPAEDWARVSVAGTRVGVLAPLDTAVIHTVRWGEYEVVLRYPTGPQRASTVATTIAQPD